MLRSATNNHQGDYHNHNHDQSDNYNNNNKRKQNTSTHRKLNSFRRQLVAAFSLERHHVKRGQSCSRRNSNITADCCSLSDVAEESRPNCEHKPTINYSDEHKHVHHDHHGQPRPAPLCSNQHQAKSLERIGSAYYRKQANNSSDPGNRGGSGNSSGSRARQWTRRQLSSSKHLIRMFADAETSSTSLGGDSQSPAQLDSASPPPKRGGSDLMGFIIGTPTKAAANCLAASSRLNNNSNRTAATQLSDLNKKHEGNELAGSAQFRLNVPVTPLASSTGTGPHLVEARAPTTQSAKPKSPSHSMTAANATATTTTTPLKTKTQALPIEVARLLEVLEELEHERATLGGGAGIDSVDCASASQSHKSASKGDLAQNSLLKFKTDHQHWAGEQQQQRQRCRRRRLYLGGASSDPLADESLRLQQDAIWELIDTELYYIGRLKLIVDLFLGTLDQIQTRAGLLGEITSGQQLASNIDQILAAHLTLWSRYLAPLSSTTSTATTTTANDESVDDDCDRVPLVNPVQFREAFANIGRTFKPYYRFCLEQSNCIKTIRKLSATSESFRVYLKWCESQHECDRFKLVDLLACPMQRLTRYSLLLRTILKSTARHEVAQLDALYQMIAFTDKFVYSVDLELNRRDEFVKLIGASNRVDLCSSVASAAGNICTGNAANSCQIQHLFKLYHNRFELTQPLFECPFSCPRQLLFDTSQSTQMASNLQLTNSSTWAHALVGGRFKFRDAQAASKLDVVVLVFTDQMIICKHEHQQPSANKKRSLRLTTKRRTDSSSNYNYNNNNSNGTGGEDDGDGLNVAKQQQQKAKSNSNLFVYSLDQCHASPSISFEESTCRDYHSDTNFNSVSLDENNNCNNQCNSNGTHTMQLKTSDNNLHWPPPAGQGRRRAASQSFLMSPMVDSYSEDDGPSVFLAESGKVAGKPRQLATTGADLFLSPARATIVRLPSDQSLAMRSFRQGSKNYNCQRYYFSKSSQHLSSSGANYQQHQHQHAPLSSFENSSNCSLTSNKNATLPDKRAPSSKLIDAKQQFVSIGALGEFEFVTAAAVAHTDNKLGIAINDPPTTATTTTTAFKLRAIRSPYPIERLVMHELTDGNSVLFCQLNDSKTIANSFVLYCSKHNQLGQKMGSGRLATWSNKTPRQSTSSFENTTPTHVNRQQQQQQHQQQAGAVTCRSDDSGANKRSLSKESSKCKNDEPSPTTKSSTVVPGTTTTTIATTAVSDNYQPKQSEQQTRVEVSQAGHLIRLVEDAQIRYGIVAKLHNRQVVSLHDDGWHDKSSIQRGQKRQYQYSRQTSPVANSRSNDSGDQMRPSSFDNLPNSDDCDAGERQAFDTIEFNKKAASHLHDDRHLKLIREQHQLFMLNHGKHEELATHEHEYRLIDERLNDFTITSKPIEMIHTSSRMSEQQQHNRSSTGSNLQRLYQRPQLGRLGRVTSDGRNDETRSIIVESATSNDTHQSADDNLLTDNLTSRSLENDHDLADESEDASMKVMQKGLLQANSYEGPIDRCLLVNRVKQSDKSNQMQTGKDKIELRPECRTSNDLLSINSSRSQFEMTDGCSSVASAQRRPADMKRRSLVSLKRQNVVLSASSDQHQLMSAHANSPPLDKKLLHTNEINFIYKRFVAVGAATSNESSSLDSGGISSITDDSFSPFKAHGNRLLRKHESNSLQTTTIDQTFDDDEKQVGSRIEDEPQQGEEGVQSDLSTLIESKPSVLTSQLQSIRSVSTNEQTSSPIAVILAVPSRASLTLSDQAASNLLVSDCEGSQISPMEMIGAGGDPDQDQSRAGCLHFGTVCLTRDKGQDGNKPVVKRRQSTRLRSRIHTLIGRLHVSSCDYPKCSICNICA